MQQKGKIIKRSTMFLAFFFFVLTCITFVNTPAQSAAPKVLINPGHSIGYDPGAINSASGVQEANVNAAVAKRLAEKLKDRGFNVYLTHPVSGCSVPSLISGSAAASLANVGNATNQLNPDLVLSIHHNSGGNASGYELYWSSYKPNLDRSGIIEKWGLWPGGVSAYIDTTPCNAAVRSRDFANLIQNAYSGFRLPYRKTVERDDYLPARANCPAVLYEGGFISNYAESLYLNSSEYHEEASNRLANAISAFFGQSGKPPTATSVTSDSSETTNAVFNVYANGVKDNGTGIKGIKFAVWTDNNGQDDLIWYDGTNQGNGNWKYAVDYRKHKNETGAYTIHVYAVDNSGKLHGLGGTKVMLKQAAAVSPGISTTNVTSQGFTIHINGYSQYKEVLVPTWSLNGGQDDIIWYKATLQTNGAFRLDVNIDNHKGDGGVYAAHVYGSDASGKLTGLGSQSINMGSGSKMTASKVSATANGNGKFTVTISGINAPKGIKNIQVPTWSANGGQDDIIWYNATKVNATTYKYEVNVRDHYSELGTYHSHVYGTDNNGKTYGLGTTSYNHDGSGTLTFKTSNVSAKGFTITIKDFGRHSGVLVPVWSETNGQDDIVWYRAGRQSDGSYVVNVQADKHKNDEGNYHIHLYGMNASGQVTNYIAAQTLKNVPTSKITASSVTNKSQGNGKFTVTISGIKAANGIKSIQVPTWSANGGQDDIVWYNATKVNATTYKYDIDVRNHYSDMGDYHSHVYGTDNSGKMYGIGGTSYKHDGQGTFIFDVSKTSAGFNVSVGNPGRYRGVYAAVWSKDGGQDDIRWYPNEKLSGGRYTFNIKKADHKQDGGVYSIHLYGINMNGSRGNYLGAKTIDTGASTKMTAKEVVATAKGNGRFTISINGINAPAGIKSIQVPTWSSLNGQDDIKWYEAKPAGNGSYNVDVDVRNHYSDMGSYAAHVYGTDNQGTQIGIGSTNFNHNGEGTFSIDSSKVSYKGFSLRIAGTGNIKELRIPIWSDVGGQDDIRWYNGVKQADGSYTLDVKTADHKYGSGNYIVHLYGVDLSGKQFSLNKATTVNVGTIDANTPMEADRVSVDSLGNGRFTVNISGVFAPNGVKTILVPTWSLNNGQDDIKWYAANKVNETTYTYTVDTRNHKLDTGSYAVHVYGTDNKGTQRMLGTTSFSFDGKVTDGTPIMGSSTVNATQLANMYRNNSSISFPQYYIDRGVNLDRFAQLFIEECAAEGVRAEVAFSQSMLETGYLRFGGQVNISQFNFAGIGATDGGPAGENFAAKYGDNEHGVRMGIRAQVQHLKAYASTANLNQTNVDPRFNLVKRGCATIVEHLGQKENPNGYGWATGQGYGQKIINIMNLIR